MSARAGEDAVLRNVGEVCAIGGVDDGSLRVCCSSHRKVLCAHHYARSHFVETDSAYPSEFACTLLVSQEPDPRPADPHDCQHPNRPGWNANEMVPRCPDCGSWAP